jgi:hypothetical protein
VADSPLQQIAVAIWHRRALPPSIFDAQKLRRAVWKAASDEFEARHQVSRFYDPGRDQRFLWAIQWLDKAEGLIDRIDPDADFFAAHLLEPATPVLCGRDCAAGEKPETLAQGS